MDNPQTPTNESLALCKKLLYLNHVGNADKQQNFLAFIDKTKELKVFWFLNANVYLQQHSYHRRILPQNADITIESKQTIYHNWQKEGF